MTNLHTINNAWGTAHITSPSTRHAVIFRAPRDAAYNHHPQITSLDGRLYATWSNGYRDEDMTGQRMLLSISGDGGETWSEACPLVDRLPGRHGEGVVTSEGIYVHAGKLIAYYGYYDISETGMHDYYTAGGNRSLSRSDVTMHTGVYTGMMTSSDKGATWQGAGTPIPRFVPNLCPARISTGRLILPGDFTFPYTDDPYGISGWTEAGIPDLPPDYVDDPEGHVKVMRHRQGKVHVCEGSFYELDDGTLRMMLRTNDAPCLAASESRDHGESWSEPVLTQYTDCHNRFHFGRLPDGRYAGLSCPAPRSARTPLVLATSTDGTTFDRHFLLGDDASFPARYPGVHKGGRYGYASYHIMDAMMYIIYSINKEDIALCRVALQDLKI